MKSMTGFGRGDAARDGRKVAVECKSVNNRYLDCAVKLPRSLNFLEEDVKAAAGRYLSRGHLEVFIRYENVRSDAKTVIVDEALLSAYKAAIARVREETGWDAQMDASVVLKMPDVLRVEEAAEDEDEVRCLVIEAAETALAKLAEMREREGRRMGDDIAEKLAELEKCVIAAQERSPEVVRAHGEALQARIKEYLDTIPLDEAKLANELAFFTDKAAVDEEMARLHSHIAAMREFLASDVPVGRQMDFLTQELNREVNTLCSKANDGEMTRIGLAMKNIVEKIREQVQNIE